MATITTINGSDLPSNSRADINTNFANLNSDKIETSVIDTDTALTANSDAKIPSQKAVKAYVDAGGNVNASTTAKGIVEEATQAEVEAGTAAGGTGARLFVNPSTAAGVKNCHIYQTSGTTVGANFTVMDFGAERFDTDTMHDNSTNPSRITFTTAGKYLVGGTVRITGANQDAGILIRLGGTTELACTNAPAGNADGGGASATVLYDFTAGQYVEFLASRGQDGSGSTSGDAKTNAWAVKIA
jgi:hypothetical protein